MFAKSNSSENEVKKNKFAKMKENLSIFKVNEGKSFLKFCKQISELNFKNKNSQFSEGSNKLGKSMLCISNYNFHMHSVQVIT